MRQIGTTLENVQTAADAIVAKLQPSQFRKLRETLQVDKTHVDHAQVIKAGVGFRQSINRSGTTVVEIELNNLQESVLQN